MENRIGFFEQFYVALIKHRKYKELVGLPKRQHLVYFFGITFLLALIAYVVPMASFLMGLGGYEQFFTEKLPAFSIENGELSIETALDFRLNGLHIIMDDSVEAYTQADVEQAEENILYFSKSNIVTNLSTIPLEIQYGLFGTDKIDNQYMAGLSVEFYVMVVVAGLLAWLLQMLSYAFLALLFAVCGMGVNRMSGADLPFKKLFCIAIYAESVFALTSHLVAYFVSSGLMFVIYFISAIISLRALNTGILVHVSTPPKL